MATHAPEFRGLTDWINSKPLTLQELRGKVVLIDFWTYSCINCIHTQPYLNAWYEKYKDDGFVIIGVHAPEFAFEHNPANVLRAVKDEKIEYPVALDNDFGTWQAFANHSWPAKYLIDQDGVIVFEHFGEGAYDEMEDWVQRLLGKAKPKVSGTGEPTYNYEQTPETYLGYERGRNFANAAEYMPDAATDYTLIDSLGAGVWSLGGQWKIGAEGSTTAADDSTLRMEFSAKEVYLVLSGPAGATFSLKVNNKAVTPTINGGPDVAAGGRVHIDGARMYRLVKLPVFAKDQILDITFPKGVTVNAFTFGS